MITIIDDRKKQQKIYFSEIKSGEYFVCDGINLGKVYLKLPETLGTFDCVDLVDGGLTCASRTAKAFTVVDIELHIKK